MRANLGTSYRLKVAFMLLGFVVLFVTWLSPNH